MDVKYKPIRWSFQEYNIRFNSNNQLIHLTDKKKVKREISIKMKTGSKIKMVDKCKYLGTTLYSDVKRKHTPDVVRYLTVSMNNLFADFSFVQLCQDYLMVIA